MDRKDEALALHNLDTFFGVAAGPHDYLKMAEDTIAIVSEVFLPGKYIIELLPWLRYFPSWVPGATVKRAGVTWRSVVQKLVEEPWRSVMTAMVCRTFPFQKDLLECNLMAEGRDCAPINDNVSDGRPGTTSW